MMSKGFFTAFLGGMVLLFLVVSATAADNRNGKPRTFLLKIEHLELTKKLWKNGDPVINQRMNALRREAGKALRQGPFTVTTKKILPPGGDRHDFFALDPYAWPNPKSKDGLPWIRRYGKSNPDNLTDWKKIYPMAKNVYTLALAYYFTGRNDFARHAASLLRTWFIDESTRMNPNAEYGNGIPGVRKGGFPVARFGMIFRQVYDAAGIIEGSPAWSGEDRKALQEWTRRFMQWAETSRYGKKEKKAENNHGTFYCLIAALQAMYIDDYDRAREILQCFMLRRIRRQFKPDGTQPFEMIRPKNYFYHIFNLEAAFDIAQLADHFDDIDIWNFETIKGAGLRRSIEFLLPYLVEQWQWDYYKKGYFDVDKDTRWRLLRKASIGFGEPLFEDAVAHYPCLRGRDKSFFNLTHPKAAVSMKIKVKTPGGNGGT